MTTKPKASSIRFPLGLADEAALVARVRGVSFNTLVVDSLASEIERARQDESFIAQLDEIITKDRALLDRLADR